MIIPVNNRLVFTADEPDSHIRGGGEVNSSLEILNFLLDGVLFSVQCSLTIYEHLESCAGGIFVRRTMHSLSGGKNIK